MRARSRLLLGLAGVFLLAGTVHFHLVQEGSETFGLGASGQSVVHFDDIQREHFRALTVDRQEGVASGRPLLVRLHFIGPAPDLSDATGWLRDELGIVVVPSADGAPVVFVAEDLATNRGSEALGATVSRGMAIETRDTRLIDCVFVHEVLHFLGLPHVEESKDIMHPRCGVDKPYRSTVSAEGREKMDRLESIRAITLTGRLTWAERM